MTTRNSSEVARCLSARLPAPVLAGLTGIKIGTAVAWNKRAGHDWAAFVAARVAAQQKT